MRKTTESKKEKIVNFYKENKDTLDEFIAIFVFGFISIVFSMLSLYIHHGIQIMLCIILFNVLLTQFHTQRAYYEIKELKEQEKKK